MKRWHCPLGKQLFSQCRLLVETRLWLALWPSFQGLDLTYLNSPIPINQPILPRNMPYYRGPRNKVDPPTLATDNKEHQRLLAYSVLHSHFEESTHLSNRPVQLGNFGNLLPPNPGHGVWYNNEFPAYALFVSQINWSIYSFNSGHFASLICTCHLLFNLMLLATCLHMDEPFWRNLLHADVFFLVLRPCWITFGDPAINQPSMGTWFTPINSSPENLPMHFGCCKLSLLLNCMLYNPYHCLLHLFTQTTTAAASCILSTISPKQDGLHHWREWTSPVIQLLDTLPILLASTTLLNHH
jgi:hypothetical protein